MKTSRYNHDSYGINVANIDERQSTTNEDLRIFLKLNWTSAKGTFEINCILKLSLVPTSSGNIVILNKRSVMKNQPPSDLNRD